MEGNNVNYGNRTNMRRRKRRYNVKRIISLLLILFLIIFGIVFSIVSLCGKKNNEKEKEVEDAITDVEPEIIVKPWEEMTEEQTISKLSGLPVLKTQANKRPVAIVINNAYEALPQSGISKAEIMYEIPVEGELVRLMGIFQDIDADKIGPVRSARHYFLDYAFDNDAIFVHYGTSPKTDTNITKYNSPSLNGLKGTYGTMMFTSDPDRVAPHDKFTSGDGITAGWSKAGYAKMRDEDKQVSLLKFGASDEMTFADKAEKVIVDYSYYQKSEFRYDSKSQNYVRYQTVSYNEMKQVDSMGTDDASDDQGLEYKNIIVQYVKKTNLINADGSVDKEGRQEIDTISSGEGLYFTNGTYEPIKWSKTDIYTPTKYTDIAGNEIEFNRGKTWICIVPNTIQAEITATSEKVASEAGTIDTMPASVKKLK